MKEGKQGRDRHVNRLSEKCAQAHGFEKMTEGETTRETDRVQTYGIFQDRLPGENRKKRKKKKRKKKKKKKRTPNLNQTSTGDQISGQGCGRPNKTKDDNGWGIRVFTMNNLKNSSA